MMNKENAIITSHYTKKCSDYAAPKLVRTAQVPN
jgi:hypothetical protein